MAGDVEGVDVPEWAMVGDSEVDFWLESHERLCGS